MAARRDDALTGKLRREVGQNAVEMMASLVIKSSHDAVTELVANSHDADASRVDIYIDRADGTILIEDDGTGMDADGVRSFFRVGDSPKLEERISPGGRERIGRFGVATLLIKYLGAAYTLETVCGGRRTKVEERFRGDLNARQQVPYTTASAPLDEHGTSLEIRDLHQPDSIDMRVLLSKLQWDLPLLPGFSVFVNDREVTARAIENATEFTVDEEGAHMGRVTGSLYLTSKVTPNAGVHIYVRGRRYGDPGALVSHSLGRANGRVVGIIHADGLEDAILFDRTRLREDHQGVRELTKLLKGRIGEVRQHSESRAVVKAHQKIADAVPGMLEQVKRRLRGIEGVAMDTVVSTGTCDNGVGRYDREVGKLVIDTSHPSLRIIPGRNAKEYGVALLHAAVDAIALSGLGKGHQMTRYNERRANIWGRLHPEAEDDGASPAREQIHRRIAYSPNELARNAGLSLGAIRYFVERGALEQTGDRISGGNFLALQEGIEGRKPFYDFVWDNWTRSSPTALDMASRILDEVEEEALAPFVENIGSNGSRCYVVDPLTERLFFAYCKSTLMARGKKQQTPTELMEEFRDQMFTEAQLAKELNLTGLQVTRGIERIGTHGFPLRQGKRTRAVTYHLGDFVEGYSFLKRGGASGF